MTVTTLSRTWDSVTIGAYTIYNNDWGANSVITNGKDYTQTVSIDSVTSKATLNWNYPQYKSPNSVWGYPEIIWGRLFWGGVGTDVYVNQIKNIKTLVVDFDTAFSGDPDKLDVMIDLWIASNNKTREAKNTVAEICINLHSFPFASTGYDYANLDFSYNIWIKPNVSNPLFIVVRPTVDMLTGKLDIALILKHLVDTGVIKSTDYIGGVELGSEPDSGSGSLEINKFIVTETVSNHAPLGSATITGTLTNGSTLSITNSIKDAEGLGKFSYTWQSDSGILSTKSTYLLANSDIGKKVWAVVSYTDKLGNFEEIQSNIVKVTVSTKSSTVNDLLTGTDKADKLNGLAGNDTLIGGSGKDSLTGGVGADVFKFNSVNDSSALPKQADTITDFKHAQGDKIDLSAIGAFTFIGTAAFDNDATGQLRFDAKTSTLYASTNADAAPELAIVLNGVKTLVADDFIF